MSHQLLSAIAEDLELNGLLNGFLKKFYRWQDVDLKGKANFVCFRMAGSSGLRDSVMQSPDVKILVVGWPEEMKLADDMANGIFKYFAGMGKPDFVVKLEPIASVLGPYTLDNGRCAFEVNVRCFIEGY